MAAWRLYVTEQTSWYFDFFEFIPLALAGLLKILPDLHPQVCILRWKKNHEQQCCSTPPSKRGDQGRCANYKKHCKKMSIMFYLLASYVLP